MKKALPYFLMVNGGEGAQKGKPLYGGPAMVEKIRELKAKEAGGGRFRKHGVSDFFIFFK